MLIHTHRAGRQQIYHDDFVMMMCRQLPRPPPPLQLSRYDIGSATTAPFRYKTYVYTPVQVAAAFAKAQAPGASPADIAAAKGACFDGRLPNLMTSWASLALPLQAWLQLGRGSAHSYMTYPCCFRRCKTRAPTQRAFTSCVRAPRPPLYQLLGTPLCTIL
jgi:hypothetical protein